MNDLRVYIVYDARAHPMASAEGGIWKGDTDNATILVTCDTLHEAQGYVREHFTDGCVYSYSRIDGVLVNEQYEWDRFMDMVPDREVTVTSYCRICDTGTPHTMADGCLVCLRYKGKKDGRRKERDARCCDREARNIGGGTALCSDGVSDIST